MDVLFPVSHDFHNRRGIPAYAVSLARQLHGHLSAIYVFEPHLAMSGQPMPMMISEAVEFMREHLKSAAEAGPDFRRWVADNGVDHSAWTVVQDAFAAGIAKEALWHDVLVVSRDESSPRGSLSMLGELLLGSRVPCIVLPPAMETTVHRHVAIAWNGSAESIRAARAAMPLLRAVERVTLLRGDRPRAPTPGGAWTPDRDVESYFASHGITVESGRLDSDGEAAGRALLDMATDSGADLLVMGAFGRSRFSEWVLGGTTRYVVQHASIPVFLRH